MKLNKRRASKLKLDYDFHGVKDKLKIMKNFVKKIHITLVKLLT